MIAVLGLGFVGLTTALGFAHKGFRVRGYDLDHNKMKMLAHLEIPFYEPGLDSVLQEELGKNFFLTDNLPQAVSDSRIVFICVGTPNAADGGTDYSSLLAAVGAILDTATDKFQTIVIKSTVPPSTADKTILPLIRAHAAAAKTGLASNPEFLREGSAYNDFINPDRIVIGAEDEESKKHLGEIYAPFGAPIHFVSRNTAEFIKYLSNAMLSTMISYANEMSIIADRVGGIDVARAFRILHEDKRWTGAPANMASYIYPGCGYGGYCLPKDTSALCHLAAAHGVKARLLEANLRINAEMADFVVDKIANAAGQDEPIGVLGLAFKKDSDDVRYSPSAQIIGKLLARGYKNIAAFDPMANKVFAGMYDFPIVYEDSLEALVYRSNHLLLLTAWGEFKDNESLIKSKTLHDFRYVF